MKTIATVALLLFLVAFVTIASCHEGDSSESSERRRLRQNFEAEEREEGAKRSESHAHVKRTVERHPHSQFLYSDGDDDLNGERRSQNSHASRVSIRGKRHDWGDMHPHAHPHIDFY